jgi:hypothetical protein
VTALDTLRAKAQKAADALRDAETKAADEAAAIRDRNAQRRRDFWSDAGTRCQDARRAAGAARKKVVDLVAAGDMPAALTAYADYVRRVVEAAAVIYAAQTATAEYVWTETRKVDPDDQASMMGGVLHRPETEKVERRMLVADWNRLDHIGPPSGIHGPARPEHPEHVGGQPPRRDSLDKLMTEGLDRLAQAHSAEFTRALYAPLNAQLEPEDDQ